MALSGNYSEYPVSYTAGGVEGDFGLYIEWSATQNVVGNYSDITQDIYLRYYRIKIKGKSGTSKIDGEEKSFSTAPIDELTNTSWQQKLLCSQTKRIYHDADGAANGVSLMADFALYATIQGTQINNIHASDSVNLDVLSQEPSAAQTYTLQKIVTPAVGGNIDIYRQSSPLGGSISYLDNDAAIYEGDKLRITYTVNANYSIESATLNGSSLASGTVYTVSDNVAVELIVVTVNAEVGATDADIGSVSTITITRHNATHKYSLQFQFVGASGYITSSGTISNSEVRFDNTSIAFRVPTDFYTQIPNARYGDCSIICRTYTASGNIVGDASTCSFRVTATGNPAVTGTVVDINPNTIGLTGDANHLIRYRSTAKATMNATAQNSATIINKFINDTELTGDELVVLEASVPKYVFTAFDSRGYSASAIVNPTMVNYIPLTLNANVSRPNPAGDELILGFNGNYYRGSFGAQSNTLTVRYRHKLSTETEAEYSDWVTVPSASYVIGSQSYKTTQSISMGTIFDYRNTYDVQVNVSDGTTMHPLTSITKTVAVQRGIPVFDWGAHDFEFHVPVKISDGVLWIGNVSINQGQLNYLVANIPYAEVPEQRGALVYNGTSQTPEWENYDPDKLLLGGTTSGTNAGDYTATFTPIGENMWADGTAGTKNIIWTINTQKVSIPTQQGTCSYNGQVQTPAWNNYNPNKLTIGGTQNATAVGTYYATFTPKTNYAWIGGSTTTRQVVWKISTATVTIPSQRGCLVYNGQPQSPEWNDYNSNQLVIGGALTGTAVGNYTANFTPREGYAWAGGETGAKDVVWSIQSEGLPIPTQSGTLVYDGHSKTPSWNNYDPDKLVMSGTTSAINAGTHVATFAPKSGYAWSGGGTESKSVNWVIGRATTTLPSQSGSLTYTGSALSPEWSNYSEAALTLGGTTSATNAGNYSATFTPKANYCWSGGGTGAKSVMWSIGRATISAPSQSGSLTYTGSAQSPKWSNYNSSKMTYGGVKSGTNAGNYTAKFTPKANYCWSGGGTGVKSVTWSIKRAKLTVPSPKRSSYPYTGYPIKPTWNHYDSGKMLIDGQISGIDVGTYTASFTLKPNYCWKDGTINTKDVIWIISSSGISPT